MLLRTIRLNFIVCGCSVGGPEVVSFLRGAHGIGFRLMEIGGLDVV